MWDEPRQLTDINGEPLVRRTIRLLRENGIVDIAISSNDDRFGCFGVPLLKHDNKYDVKGHNKVDGAWYNGFYPVDEPVCYVFGDVVFSPEAIQKIVETDTGDIELFGSAKPFAKEYPKKWVEPFAFKVRDTEHLKKAVAELRKKANTCWRPPIAWDLWALIKGRRIDIDDYRVDYTVINDYTCDLDFPKDVKRVLKWLVS